MEHNEMLLRLKNDSIKNDELCDCLNSKNSNIVGQTIYKVIARAYCDEFVIKALTRIAPLLNGYKVMGPYQLGHLAIATLFLVNNKSALQRFKQISNDLSDNDKFLVDNFIKGMREKGDV